MAHGGVVGIVFRVVNICPAVELFLANGFLGENCAAPDIGGVGDHLVVRRPRRVLTCLLYGAVERATLLLVERGLFREALHPGSESLAPLRVREQGAQRSLPARDEAQSTGVGLIVGRVGEFKESRLEFLGEVIARAAKQRSRHVG